jgi:hypothetical protein
MRAHLICAVELPHCVDRERQLYRVGQFDTVTVKEEHLEALVASGGSIYCHKKKSEPSYFGGKVVGYSPAERDPDKGRRDAWWIEVEETAEGRGVEWSREGRHDKMALYSGLVPD